MKEFTIKFFAKSGAEAEPVLARASKGTDVLSAAIKAGLNLSGPCGGEGLCGKCKVVIRKGKAKSNPSRLISAKEAGSGVVLACQTFVEDDLDVEVPSESLVSHAAVSCESEEFTRGVVLRREREFALSPLVRKEYLKLAPPTAQEAEADLERISRQLAARFDGVHISTRLANVKNLGELMRESGFELTVAAGFSDDAVEILSVEAGNTSGANFGFAFDIGTTTVAGQLLDLNKGDVLGTRIAFNRQASYGSDVITRIIHGSTPQGLGELNEAVLGNVNEMIEDLTAAHRKSPADIYAVNFAGNMTMMHLLLKIDPSNIRKAPYVPVTTAFQPVHSSEVGLKVSPRGISSFIPGVSTYIGGDIVAGVLACGLYEDEELSLLVDVGTNGEIVLGNRDWMMGAAASAGPAFEGSGLSCGMKAVKGAINKVSISRDLRDLKVEFEAIGGGPPKGICGSGYIDLLCQMFRSGIMEKDGRLRRGIRSKRLRMGESNYEFVVAFENEAGLGKDIVIQEDDIENLKRAKGAIYSAIMSLVNKVEKRISDVRKVYIAGGFGNYLNIENAIFIGLVPDMPRDAYEFIGNSSLAGARISLLSREAYVKTARIAKNITYLDLSSEPRYMDEYIASLFFPHTDMERFPSVKA